MEEIVTKRLSTKGVNPQNHTNNNHKRLPDLSLQALFLCVSFSLSHTSFLFISLCNTLSLSLCLSGSHALPFSLPHSFCESFSLSHKSHPPFLSLCLSGSHTLPFSLSLALSLCLFRSHTRLFPLTLSYWSKLGSTVTYVWVATLQSALTNDHWVDWYP